MGNKKFKRGLLFQASFFTDLYNFKCLLLVNINFQFEINYICKMKEKNLFPSIEPREKGLLQVSKIHSIYWERSGNPKGKKILVIHGGPGGGSQPRYRRYFNPEKFDIVQFDQRGCGYSRPFSELRENTTGGLDFSPLFVFILIQLVSGFLDDILRYIV